jgi:hypothetical protein
MLVCGSIKQARSDKQYGMEPKEPFAVEAPSPMIDYDFLAEVKATIR